MYPVQILVITISKARRTLLEKQFQELAIPFTVNYMEASSPDNSIVYLPPNCTDRQARNICCSRSHLRAIQAAANPDAPEFTIIMEDDIALHKILFTPLVIELLENWHSIMKEKDSSMISLGWIPCKNYETYLSAQSCHQLSTPNIKLLRDRFAPGLQAYMLHKSTAVHISPFLIHDTFQSLYDCLKSKNIPHIRPSDTLESTDFILPQLLLQTLVCPPVIIEQPVESTLGHTNEILYWSPYFKNYEHIRQGYWSSHPQ